MPGSCFFQASGFEVQQNIDIGKPEFDDDWPSRGRPQDVGAPRRRKLPAGESPVREIGGSSRYCVTPQAQDVHQRMCLA